MGVDIPQPSALRRLLDDVEDCLAGQRLSAFRDEQPWKLVYSGCKLALDRPELVAGDRVLH